jgi:hypothetical protein
MKRRLTLAIGCLACAMHTPAAVVSAKPARTEQFLTDASPNLQQPPTPVLSLAEAAQLAQTELSARNLTSHEVVSVIFLKTAEPATGHYDVRIHPPARLTDATWLRGFTVGLDGALSLCTSFRTSADLAETAKTLSTLPNSDPPRDSGLGSDQRQG